MIARRLALLSCLLITASCREGVPPFTPAPETPSEADPRQLTFGLGDERNPQWSADGDSIYFQSNNWYDAPGPGTLLRISPDGGHASPLADYAQPVAATYLADPVTPRNGGSLAYLHFARIRAATSCAPANPSNPNSCVVAEPLLDSAVLRVRSSTAINPATTDPGLAIHYAGLDPGQWGSEPPPYQQHAYQFQIDLRSGESVQLRSSWSPDGSRLVFSDGLGLDTWAPAEPAATPLPDTDRGVSPAWSPDGNWIAFTIIERADSMIAVCGCGPGNVVQHLRTWWPVAGYLVALIHPDGTGLTELGAGREPAWAPDSRSLYVRRTVAGEDAIYRIPVDQPTSAVMIDGTSGGRTPAVSPDGAWLAFIRRKPDLTKDLDLWITSLGK